MEWRRVSWLRNGLAIACGRRAATVPSGATAGSRPLTLSPPRPRSMLSWRGGERWAPSLSRQTADLIKRKRS
jgi:hypothetical protein